MEVEEHWESSSDSSFTILHTLIGHKLNKCITETDIVQLDLICSELTKCTRNQNRFRYSFTFLILGVGYLPSILGCGML